ncbi:MAG: insulinase family protein [Paucimonas sp.]|jgi:zinc protease|nr:insulinase family protein [Paucimonas sp.]
MSTPSEQATATALASLTTTRTVDLRQYQTLQHQVQQWQTPEGTRARFVACAARPMFDLVLRFRAGSSLDGDTPGLAALVLYSLDQGTALLDAAQFVEQLEGVGAILSREIGLDHSSITLRGLSLPALRSKALQLLTAMVTQPAFRAADTEKIKLRLLRHLQNRTRHSTYLLSDTTMAQLFAGHPYATAEVGTPAGLASIADEQLRNFHRRAYSANNLDIGLVGDLSREDAEALVGAISAALPQQWAAIPPPPAPARIAESLPIDRPNITTQAALTYTLQLSPADPGYPALLMLDQILGADYESRLMQVLRVQHSLTYSIHSRLRPLDAACLLQIFWDIEPAYRDASRALVTQVVQDLCNHGPSQAECDLALSQLTGGLLIAMADNGELAKSLARSSHQQQPVDHLSLLQKDLASLTPLALRNTARTCLQSQQATFVTIGPAIDQQPLPADQLRSQSMAFHGTLGRHITSTQHA